MKMLQSVPVLFYLFLNLIPSADCCPIFLKNSHLPTRIPQDLHDWIFFAKSYDGVIHYFPHDIIYLSKNGIMSPEKPAPQDAAGLEIVLSENSALRAPGYERMSQAELPCSGIGLEYVLAKEDKAPAEYIYGQKCPSNRRTSHQKTFSGSQKVIYESDKHIISSPTYSYSINEKNYMLFKEIDYLSEQGKQALAFDSQLYIFADVKNFFSLLFDQNDIGSHMYASHTLNTGMHAAIDFFLQVLFFKVSLNLVVDAFFYPDSVHIPMRVSLPISAKKYLHDTSGIFYTWFIAADLTSQSENIPVYSSATLLDQIHSAQKTCNSVRENYCSFDLVFHGQEQILKMHFTLAKSLIDIGFFPQLVLDPESFQKNQRWPESIAASKNMGLKKQVGLFFSTAQLEKGEYQWDFWIEIFNKNQKTGQKNRVCPRRAYALKSL